MKDNLLNLIYCLVFQASQNYPFTLSNNYEDNDDDDDVDNDDDDDDHHHHDYINRYHMHLLYNITGTN